MTSISASDYESSLHPTDNATLVVAGMSTERVQRCWWGEVHWGNTLRIYSGCVYRGAGQVKYTKKI